MATKLKECVSLPSPLTETIDSIDWCTIFTTELCPSVSPGNPVIIINQSDSKATLKAPV